MLKKENPTDVREKIIDAARGLFIQRGFKGTTVRDIASVSDTNVAMVNYYFQSKYKLFEEIFNDALEVLSSKIFEIIDSEKPIRQMVEEWITVYYDMLFEYPEFPLFVLNELSQNPEVLQKKIEEKNPYQVFMRMTERFDKEAAEGRVRPIFSPNFILVALSLSMYPFVFSPVAKAFLNMTQEEYTEVLKEHKNYVIDFMIHAIEA